MEKVVVELEAKTGKAEASLQDVVNAIQDINKATVESNKDTAKSLKEVEKSSGQAAKGIKAIGTGLKALGIGLVIAALGTLKDLFSQNQKVVDVFNTTFEVAGQVVSQATTAFTKIYDALSKSTDQFDALGKVASGLVTIAITPLKLAFYGVQLGIDTAMLAWEKSFLGDKNPETIKALNLSIIETKTNILEVGAAALEAGEDVVTNFVEAVAEVGAAGEVVVKELGKVNIKNAIESAKAITALKKSAELASVLNQGLIEKYDRQAEKLRQIRDDESKSIEDRIKANSELALILDEQEVAMKKNAQIAVAAAAAELSKNKDSIALQKAYQEALNEQAAIEAQITGFRSEQQTNTNSLLKEQKEIMNEISLFGKSERDKEKLELLQEYDLNKELIERQVTDEAEKKERLLALQTDYNTRLREINDEFNVGEIERAEARILLEEQIAQRKRTINLEYVNFAGSLSGLMQQIAGKNKAIALAGLVLEKGAAIANVVLKAQESIAVAKANEAKIPFFTQLGTLTLPNFAKPASMAGTAKSILSTKLGAGLAIASIGASSIGRGGSVSDGGTPPAPPSIPSAPPAFNIVGQSNTNQLADAIGGQSRQPTRAYVVSSDVTTSQEMDRNIITESGT